MFIMSIPMLYRLTVKRPFNFHLGATVQYLEYTTHTCVFYTYVCHTCEPLSPGSIIWYWHKAVMHCWLKR